MGSHCKFLIIDDDPVNNMLCDYVISDTLPQAEVTSLTEPEKGIDYLQTRVANDDTDQQTVSVLLDINMPSMSGWDVLNELQKMEPAQLQKFKVFMLSSSKDERDLDKAAANPLVQEYFVKPLTKEMLGKIIRYNPCRD